VVVVAGGLGIAPLRPVLYHLAKERKRFGRCFLLYGARMPSDLLFADELKRWKKQGKFEVHLAVGQADAHWRGTVGHVTALLSRISLVPEKTFAFVCGPEVMMRFTVTDLEKLGVAKDRIYVSLERNMKCAIGFCGHCQLGTELICRPGAVFPYAKVERLLRIREL
jgi:NAD(P)H-flavin reductase